MLGVRVIARRLIIAAALFIVVLALLSEREPPRGEAQNVIDAKRDFKRVSGL